MILLSKNVNKSKLIRVHTPTGCVHRSMDSLPRRENSPPDCFLIRLSSPFSHQKREGSKATLSTFFHLPNYKESPTILRIAVDPLWTLPRAKKCPPDTFYTSLRTGAALSSPSSSTKKSRCPNGHLDFLVREMGLEPTRRNHTHLKRACLPFQHSRKR